MVKATLVDLFLAEKIHVLNTRPSPGVNITKISKTHLRRRGFRGSTVAP